MKLVQLYLIGVFVMIAFLVGSTMWQYQQFQTNVKNLQFGLPQELTSMPNANDQLSQMMGQIQSQAQTQVQQNSYTAATSTKTYTAPDGSFSFDYPSDWTESSGQIAGTMFAAFKNNNQSLVPSTAYLTIERSSASSTEAIIEEIKNNVKAKKSGVKIAESQIINGEQTIPVIEANESFSEPITKTSITLNNTAAVIEANNELYVLSIATQNDNQVIQNERTAILNSIKINEER